MSYTAISLFSGMGGDSLGLTQANCKVVAYNEKMGTYCISHHANFPECELIEDKNDRDIVNLKSECFEKFTNKIDIVFAGFPCQGFSQAGKKNDNDPRNTLFREFLRVATIVQPKMIIGENVKGLLTRRTNNKELYIDIIVREFEKIGYTVAYKVLKAEEYQVPQKRERLIIIGTKNDNPYQWTPKFPEPIKKQSANLLSFVKYDMTGALRIDPQWFAEIPEQCILEDFNDSRNYQENEGAHPYLVSKRDANELNRTYDGKIHTNLFSFGKRISPIHCEIVDIRKPAKTIICSYDHQPRMFVPLKNSSGCFLRMFTPHELKQIQGFPAEYIVCGNKKEQIVQIGNAVPPPLIQAVVNTYTSP